MPNLQVKGWRAYTAAVANLFDPAESHADMISIRPVDDDTLEMRWRLEGVLKLPGRPRIKPYTGTTRYTMQQRHGLQTAESSLLIVPDTRRYNLNRDHLVQSHVETWDISAFDAFASAIIPGFGAPPAPPIEELRARV